MDSLQASIDFDKIKQEKVKALLRSNGLFSVNDLGTLHSFCFNQDDGKYYHKHRKAFLIHKPIDEVWNAYKTISPEEAWNGKMVSFGLMYSRQSKEITYPGDPYSGIEAGQIIFLHLNLLGNIINLAVGHEITAVKEEEKIIKICYLQNGASTGTQIIQLKEPKADHTEVIHETWYRSGSIFRDKILYPGFHEKGLTEFHQNIKFRIEGSQI